MKKYKILKDCKYSPNGISVKELKPGEEVELPDSIGVPFSSRGLCELCKPEKRAEKAQEKIELPEEKKEARTEEPKKKAPKVDKERAKKKK